MALTNDYSITTADLYAYLSMKQWTVLTNDGCVSPITGTPSEAVMQILLDDGIGTVESFMRKNYKVPFTLNGVVTLPEELKGMMIRFAVFLAYSRKNILQDWRKDQYDSDIERLKEWEREDKQYSRYNLDGVRVVRRN